MISYARQNSEELPDVPPPPADDYIAPAPRVSVQAFCETAETAAAVRSAGEDRRLGKAHLTVKMGGVAAAIEAYQHGAYAERDHPGDRSPAAIFLPASMNSQPCAIPEPASS